MEIERKGRVGKNVEGMWRLRGGRVGGGGEIRGILEQRGITDENFF